MARFSFSDGRWVELRPPTLNEMIALEEIQKDDSLDGLVRLRDLLQKTTLAVSWDGDIGDMTAAEIGRFLPVWIRASQDDALPPPSAPPSETPPSAPKSGARTASRRKSPGRSSTTSIA